MIEVLINEGQVGFINTIKNTIVKRTCKLVFTERLLSSLVNTANKNKQLINPIQLPERISLFYINLINFFIYSFFLRKWLQNTKINSLNTVLHQILHVLQHPIQSAADGFKINLSKLRCDNPFVHTSLHLMCGVC